MATYDEIRSVVRTQYGKNVQSCWIAHVKELNGLKPKPAPNRYSVNSRVKPCPDAIRPLIEAAMRHFKMI